MNFQQIWVCFVLLGGSQETFYYFTVFNWTFLSVNNKFKSISFSFAFIFLILMHS